MDIGAKIDENGSCPAYPSELGKWIEHEEHE